MEESAPASCAGLVQTNSGPRGVGRNEEIVRRSGIGEGGRGGH